jgi:hypothetical protein
LEYQAALRLQTLLDGRGPGLPPFISALSRRWVQERKTNRPTGTVVGIQAATPAPDIGKKDVVVSLGSDVYNAFTHKIFSERDDLIVPVLVHKERDEWLPASEHRAARLLNPDWFTTSDDPPRLRRLRLPGPGVPTISTRDYDVEQDGYTRDVAIVQRVSPKGGSAASRILLISGLGAAGTLRASEFVFQAVSASEDYGGLGRKSAGRPWSLPEQLVVAWYVRLGADGKSEPDFESEVHDDVGVLWPANYYQSFANGTRPANVPTRLN